MEDNMFPENVLSFLKSCGIDAKLEIETNHINIYADSVFCSIFVTKKNGKHLSMYRV
jgi:hypothetical protein